MEEKKIHIEIGPNLKDILHAHLTIIDGLSTNKQVLLGLQDFKQIIQDLIKNHKKGDE